jgi:4-oxalocrotonate tautomerase
MPHVVIKMLRGRSEETKKQLAQAITHNVMSIAGVGEDSVSVAIEDVEAADWTEQVYKPDIAGKGDTLYKQPGYKPT